MASSLSSLSETTEEKHAVAPLVLVADDHEDTVLVHIRRAVTTH